MKIIMERPPNFERICAAFPVVRSRKNVIFCYGDAIYNPNGIVVTKALMNHERVHSQCQGALPAIWWTKYLADRQFRFDEELAAHVVEYETELAGCSNRLERRHALAGIAAKLASPIYGGICTKERATALLRKLANPEPIHVGRFSRDEITR